ncbi:DMT family transporter [Yoonia sp. 208BN28-4]|uniref:DMT family transporter n=1 Tax=Yoonia sp. 208BN28-4 TaxID=3126505 RepID=UPI00309DA616
MNPLRGIAFKMLSVCTFVCMASLIKATAADVPPGQAVFFRSIFALPVIVVWLAATGHLHDGIKTENPMGHFWRGIVGTMGMGFGFAGLGLLPLPEVTAIGYAAPLLVVVFAAMFLNERVRAFRLTAVFLGLVGVVIVLSPRLSVSAAMDVRETLGAVVVLMGAACAALAHVFIRKLTATERTSAIVFWFAITSTTLSLLTIPFGWVWPAWGTFGLLVLAGLIGGLGQIFLTSSYRYADASMLAPFDYTSMILAVLIGWFVFSEAPTMTTIIGSAVVICAGVLIIWRERQLGLERAAQRQAMGNVAGK